MDSRNVLLMTDVYKLGHMQQYKPGTEYIQAYLLARSTKKVPFSVMFGNQYIYKHFLSQKITQEMASELYEDYESILGPVPEDVREKIQSLVALGFIPLEIKTVAEGSVVPNGNVLLTVKNTIPGFHWVVGYFESLILKLWGTSTVAAYDLKLHHLMRTYSELTCDNHDHLAWQVHDFGYRSKDSEESAALCGAAHLVGFHRGTDTVPSVRMLKNVYSAAGLIGASVPASEHSVMCSFGQENEIEAFRHMLKTYAKGIVSIVSDTYNFWNVLMNFTEELRADIEGRDGKLVFRPDSGDPVKIICGDPDAPEGSPENLGAMRILDQKFGSTVNNKGFRVLNPKVGLIYGDGMYYERLVTILERLKSMGYASSNIVFGIGGLLLNHSRDDLGFAIKAIYSKLADGTEMELQKDPITDKKKRSHKGRVCLLKGDLESGAIEWLTKDQVSEEEEKQGALSTFFKDGGIMCEVTLDEVRKNVETTYWGYRVAGGEF